jgi:hypothetical protein
MALPTDWDITPNPYTFMEELGVSFVLSCPNKIYRALSRQTAPDSCHLADHPDPGFPTLLPPVGWLINLLEERHLLLWAHWDIQEKNCSFSALTWWATGQEVGNLILPNKQSKCK